MGREISRRLSVVLPGRRLAYGHHLAVPSLLRRALSDEFRQAAHGLAALARWLCLLGLAVLAPQSPASAHAFLERANPPVGSEIAASPPELSITFTEGVEPLFSNIELHAANGPPVVIGKLHTAANDDRKLVVELPKLAPGTYQVIWHATSVDTHKTEGSYRFTVVPR